MASIVAISSPSSSLSTRAGLLLPRSFNDNGRRRTVVVRAEGSSGEHINPAIRKSEEKVVDSVLIAELSKPLTPYCRCWRSGTFPLCDGSHVKHNKATGDNVGPLLLKK
ncbi:CDGSH iron-sulfur domain-containing protein NEET [Cucumis melo var. makuwa]|uniref:CDGSH iron-sulfur domain-containing protein NEET n=2 Tax=Cucumis melo TaxID=3656 RepID=A0A5A7UKN7_CUCMM|nr:CDGSH iron-sulfur domain-containing protein NEET [Cucumis melo var. makuwa]